MLSCLNELKRAKGQSPPQELKVGPHSGPYFLVFRIFSISQTFSTKKTSNWYFLLCCFLHQCLQIHPYNLISSINLRRKPSAGAIIKPAKRAVFSSVPSLFYLVNIFHKENKQTGISCCVAFFTIVFKFTLTVLFPLLTYQFPTGESSLIHSRLLLVIFGGLLP